jgi:putative photosynthetic complex assembly protein
MSMTSTATISFPRAPLYGAAVLVCFALGIATFGRVSGLGAERPVSTPISERYLRFEDRADGAVVVYDARVNPTDANAQPIGVETGQNGFLRGVLRGFARTRRADSVGASAPFHLTAWADGRLTLEDPSTGRHSDLEAFGPANVPVFSQFLVPPGRIKVGSAAP